MSDYDVALKPDMGLAPVDHPFVPVPPRRTPASPPSFSSPEAKDWYKNQQEIMAAIGQLPQGFMDFIMGKMAGPSPEEYSGLADKQNQLNALYGQGDAAAEQSRGLSNAENTLQGSLAGIATPIHGLPDAPDYPSLDLPPVPNLTQPKANPLMSLAAAVLGLAHPHSAGDFAAAAGRGAIETAQRQNEFNQEQYRNLFQRVTTQHEDAMRRADRQHDLNAERADIQYKNSQEDERSRKESALETYKATVMGGDAGVAEKLRDAGKTALPLQQEIESRSARINREEQQAPEYAKIAETAYSRPQTTAANAANAIERIKSTQANTKSSQIFQDKKQKDAQSFQKSQRKDTQLFDLKKQGIEIKARKDLQKSSQEYNQGEFDRRLKLRNQAKASNILRPNDSRLIPTWQRMQDDDKQADITATASNKILSDPTSKPEDKQAAVAAMARARGQANGSRRRYWDTHDEFYTPDGMPREIKTSPSGNIYGNRDSRKKSFQKPKAEAKSGFDAWLNGIGK